MIPSHPINQKHPPLESRKPFPAKPLFELPHILRKYISVSANEHFLTKESTWKEAAEHFPTSSGYCISGLIKIFMFNLSVRIYRPPPPRRQHIPAFKSNINFLLWKTLGWSFQITLLRHSRTKSQHHNMNESDGFRFNWKDPFTESFSWVGQLSQRLLLRTGKMWKNG